MYITRHAMARMAQRGFSQDMIEYVLTNGSLKGDKTIMGRKEILQRIAENEKRKHDLKKILCM